MREADTLARERCDQQEDADVIDHQAEEDGYWAEVPAIPGCTTQGDSFEELLQNIYEVVEGCPSVDVEENQIGRNDKVLEIAV